MSQQRGQEIINVRNNYLKVMQDHREGHTALYSRKY